MSRRSLPQPPEPIDSQWGRQLVDDLEASLLELNQPANIGYAMTNVTTTRALDANATTLAEVADVLATLIQDLKTAGRLG